ncbi:MAG: N,N-dimethylformamidase beta subunit family domain-containing protein [Ilumatobacteraceae bacterium]
MADDITGYNAVEGYAGRLSVRAGDELTLHVRCTTERFDVSIYRWGAERRLVWSAVDLAGVAHPIPADADANGCGWPAAVTLAVPEDWPSGFYDVTLRAHGAAPDRAESHACFVVRGPVEGRAARALLVIATNTYHAYNSWGGRSLYTGGHQVSYRRPFGRGIVVRPIVERDDRKSWPVRWGEEPDIDGDRYQRHRWANGLPGYMASAGWFTYERRFVEWAERSGFALDFAVSTDLEHDPSALDGYSLVLGVGHDEYWSAAGRDAVEAHVRNGGTYASLSGNTMFWQVRVTADGDSMVCHKYSAHVADPVMGTDAEATMSGMWSDHVVGRPEHAFLGARSASGLYSRFGKATPRASGAFTVYRSDHWLLEGTGLRYGDQLGARDGVVGYETVGCPITFDEVQLPVPMPGRGTPPDAEIIAFAPSSNLAMGEYPKSIAALDDQGDLEFIAERVYGGRDEVALAKARHGNSVMMVSQPYGPSAGEVITIGSTDWVFGLEHDPAVGAVTANVMRRGLAPRG